MRTRKLKYDPLPLKMAAGELEKTRSVSRFCRELKISRTHFYDVIKGESASYPMLQLVSDKLGVPFDALFPKSGIILPKS
jgi:hypothetical protein